MQRLVHLLLCGTTAGCLITPGIRDDRQDQLDQTDPAVIVRVLHPDGRPLPDASVELIGGPDGVVQTNAAGWVKRLAAPAHGEWVIRASRGGFAPTSSPVDVKADAVGLTLVLSRLQEGRVVRSSQTVNEAGRRALAFPTGVVATHGSVDLEHVFASTHDAPNALGLDQFDNRVTLDVFDAVYVAGSVADVLDGQPLTYRVQEVPGSPLAAAPDDQVSLWRFDLTQGMWLEEERWRAGAATTEQPNTHWLAWLDSFDTWYAIAAPTDGDPVELQTLDPGGSRMAHVEVRLTEPGLVSAKRFQTNKNGVVFDGVPLLGSQGSVHLLRRLQNTGGLALVEQMPFGPQTPPIQVPVFADADRDDYWTDGRCAAGDCEQAYQWGDCDDTDRNVHPGLSKDSANNGIDDNCDGLVDGVDLDRDGVDAEVDCDDTDPTRTPGTMALCVPDDDNCNGVADETEVHLAPRPPDTSLANGDTCHRCEIQTLIDTDPVLYIPFDDESTTWASDRSGWGRDLAISNLTERGPGIDHWNGTTPYWPGKIDSFAYYGEPFEAGNAILPVDWWPTEAITMSIWIKPGFQGRTILSYYALPQGTEDPLVLPWSGCRDLEDAYEANEFKVHLGLGQLVVAVADLKARYNYKDGPEIRERAWNHLVISWRLSTQDAEGNHAVEIYINGESVGTPRTLECDDALDESIGVPIGEHRPLRTGGWINLGQDLDLPPTGLHPDSAGQVEKGSYQGAMDELLIYDRSLSAEEIRALYFATICDEEPDLCNGVDDDEDGTADERSLGTSAPGCAASCLDIQATQSEMGPGPYAVLDDNGLVVDDDGWCDLLGETSKPTHWCGDNVINTITDLEHLESCDDVSDPFCVGCALDYSAQAYDCADILAIDPDAVDGPYLIDYDLQDIGMPWGANRDPVEALCDFHDDDGDGVADEAWTLVNRLDTQAFTLFFEEGRGFGPCPSGPGTGFVEYELCTDDTNCECICSRGGSDCLGPREAKYSTLAWLDSFQVRAPGGCIEYDLRWPTDEDGVRWAQDWLPLAPRVGEWSGAFAEPHASFVGLAQTPAESEWQNACPYPDYPPTFEDQWPAGPTDGVNHDEVCRGFYTVGMHTAESNEYIGFGHPSYPSDDNPLGTTKTVELWARVPEADLCTFAP